jgi:hypothetical protein
LARYLLGIASAENFSPCPELGFVARLALEAVPVLAFIEAPAKLFAFATRPPACAIRDWDASEILCDALDEWELEGFLLDDVERLLSLTGSIGTDPLTAASSDFTTSREAVSTELVEDVLALEVPLSVRVKATFIAGGCESSSSSFSLDTLVASNAGKVCVCFVGVVPVGASSWADNKK